MNTISLRNCKNFDSATFCIEQGRLNIKYAPNGTGKSSIADGIRYAITNNPALLESITPFKHRNNPDSPAFESSGLDVFNSVEVFDESYVSDVVFAQNELFSSGFEVFVKSPEYEETLKRIDELLGQVQEKLNGDALRDLGNALGVFSTNVCGNSGLTNSNQLRATAPAKKGLQKGNPRVDIPAQFEVFRAYIDSDRLSQWTKWHANGHKILLETDDRCPFCGQEIKELSSLLSAVKNEYVAANADNLDKATAGIVAANDYLHNDTIEMLENIIQTNQPLTTAQGKYLSEVAIQANTIADSLRKARSLSSYFNLAKAGGNLAETIADCAIDLELLAHFNSDEMRQLVKGYNEALANAAKEAKVLFGVINKQKKKLADALAGYEAEINTFFTSAGYPYTVSIVVSDEGQCSVSLIHTSSYQIKNAGNTLSYGERNALALVFFMYSALSNNPDLIILDDPITSFDGHKRFALLHMLFLKDDCSPNSLKGRTVILLTHEYGVVFDVEHTLKSELQPLAKTTLLHIANDTISETIVEKDDMKPVRTLYQELARSSHHPLARLAYARKLIELDDSKGLEWDYLSSLFHHRNAPAKKDGTLLNEEETKAAAAKVEQLTGESPNYTSLIQQVTSKQAMLEAFQKCSCRYEKLQIARIALDGENVDRVSKKMLDETLHVDNGYIFQLDPRDFETVSDSIIHRCEDLLSQSD
ncbi:AAA family ATPase [uncultured Slackia sp.]|uniref:AAA family ATPase n=1 Tax=uncultured Slackia sp. TaxID=665903 RepID=UPI0026DEA7B4|nr:AAA family ATPase [uncultured Slackia sp.]